MKNKLIISAVMAAVLPISSVFAAANLNNISTTLTADNKGVMVSGKVDSDVDELVIMVSDTNDYYEAQNADDAQFIAATVVDMYKKTEFSETLKIGDELTSGRYYIYLSGNGINPVAPIELWYQQETDRAALISEICNASDETLQTVMLGDEAMNNGELYDRADKLGLKNEFYKDSYDNKVTQLMKSKRSTDYSVLKNNFTISSAIAAFENSSFDWMDSEKKLISNIWAENDVEMGNAQKHFEDSLLPQGRQNVINALSGRETYLTFDDFYEAFAKEVIYNGIYKSSKMGTEHHSGLISELSAASGYDFSEYISLSESQKADVGLQLYNAGATDFDTMTKKLSTIISGLGETRTEDTNTGGNGGGGGGGGNPVISGTPPTYIPNVSTGFTDIDGVLWAKDAIENLKAKNIISGTGDGKFEPNRAVKREEFIKMLITALEIPVGSVDASFTDVLENAWYAPYISAALKLEITSGMGDGSFGIGESLTREQCCAFIYRACKDKNFSGEEKAFKDADKVSEFAKESVKALSTAGIIVGDEQGYFNPTDKITRAQTAVMIHRLISGGIAK